MASLYGNYDPTRALVQSLIPDPLANLGIPRRQGPKYPAFGPEEEQEVLDRVLGAGSSLLEITGNVLDTPGSVVRGLLAGDPGAAFGGVFDPDSRVSGRDMLETWGVLDENVEGFSPFANPGDALGDVAGFAAEVATDPLSFLTFGGLTAAGKVAQRGVEGAPELVRGLGAGIKAGQRSLVSVGLPFTDNALHFGTSEALGSKVADAGEWLNSLAPVRYGRAALDPRVGGEVSREAQKVKEGVYYNNRKAEAEGKLRAAAFRRQAEPLFDTFRETMEAAGKVDPVIPETGFNYGDVVQAADRNNFGRVIGASADGTVSVLFREPRTGSMAKVHFTPDQLKVKYRGGEMGAEEFAQDMARSVFGRLARMTGETKNAKESAAFLGLPDLPDELASGLESLGDDIAEANAAITKEYHEWGGKGGTIRELEESVDGRGYRHMPGYVDRPALDSAGARILNPMRDSSKAREPVTRMMPREVVNAAVKDADLRVREPVYRTVGGKPKVVSYETATPEQQAAALEAVKTKYGRYLDPNWGQKLDEAGNVVEAGSIDKHAADLLEYVNGQSAAFAAGDLDMYGRPFLEADEPQYLVQGLQAVAAQKQIHNLFRESLGTGTVPLRQAFEKAGMDPDRALAKMAELTGQAPEALAQAGVDDRIVAAVQGVWKTFDDPEWAKGIGATIDWTNSIVKESLTQVWPAHHGRNFFGGQYQNLTAGLVQTFGDMNAYRKMFSEAFRLRKGGDRQLLDELDAHGVIVKGYGGQGVATLRRHRDGVTPASPFDLAGSKVTAQDYVDQNPSVLDKLRPTAAARKGYNTAMATGSALGEQVEWLNRVPYYLYLTRHKKFSPAAAAEEVKRVQFDYRDKTAWEKKWASRLVPFWSFSKKVMPLTVKTLLERPGGAMAQTIRGAQTFKEEAPYVPSHLQETPAIYLGGDRFLTKFGLPFEDPLSRLVVEPTFDGSIGRTVEKNFASAHPALTFLYSSMSGRDPFFGRQMEDLPEYPTNDLLLNSLISKSPASRGVTSFRTLMDDRKGAGTKALNLLTGFDVTDVWGGLEGAKIKDAGRALDKLSAESPNLGEFTDFYARSGQPLTPEDIDLLRLNTTLEKNKAAFNRGRAQEEARGDRSLAGKLGG